MAQQYRKAVVVEAIRGSEIIRAVEQDRSALPDWLQESHAPVLFMPDTLMLTDREGILYAHVDDWIVRDVDGTLRAVSDDIFSSNYEAVDNPDRVFVGGNLYGEALLFVIGEFMNLVDACESKGVEFEPVDGCDLDCYRDTINNYLERLGYDDAQIADIWSGELQLTSS